MSYNSGEYIISVEEQKEIVDWVLKNHYKLEQNGFNRKKKCMDKIKDIPNIVWDIKKRIIDIEKLYDAVPEPELRDSIGYMIEGGQLHLHKDRNAGDLIHTRFNVYVQIPYEGGLPIYDDKVINVKERTYVCCRSGIDVHYCQKVVGEKGRIILSYGFLLPFDRIKDIVYE